MRRAALYALLVRLGCARAVDRQAPLLHLRRGEVVHGYTAEQTKQLRRIEACIRRACFVPGLDDPAALQMLQEMHVVEELGRDKRAQQSRRCARRTRRIWPTEGLVNPCQRRDLDRERRMPRAWKEAAVGRCEALRLTLVQKTHQRRGRVCTMHAAMDASPLRRARPFIQDLEAAHGKRRRRSFARQEVVEEHGRDAQLRIEDSHSRSVPRRIMREQREHRGMEKLGLHRQRLVHLGHMLKQHLRIVQEGARMHQHRWTLLLTVRQEALRLCTEPRRLTGEPSERRHHAW